MQSNYMSSVLILLIFVIARAEDPAAIWVAGMT